MQRKMRRQVDTAMAAAGLSFARGKLLSLIAAAGPIRPGELAIALDQAPRTIATASVALERDGLVVRAAHPRDRRAHLLEITEKGRLALQEASLPRTLVIEQLFGCLSDKQQAELTALLRKVDESTDTVFIETPPPA